jgi:phosphoribosyl 1,2-cyclic phosphodiesterase
MLRFDPHHSGSKGNFYTVTNGEEFLAIEAGVSIKEMQIASGFRLTKLAGCLISHAHGDHGKSAKRLMDSGVECYMSEETARTLQVMGHHRVRLLNHEEQVQVGPFKVMPFEVRHDRNVSGTMGFVIDSNNGGRLLYLTDAVYFDYSGIEGITIFAIEANYDPEIVKRNIANHKLDPIVAKRVFDSHMSINTALKILSSNDLSKTEEVHLLHLSDGNSNADNFKRRVEEATGRPCFIAGEK